ncbi:MAG: hypothetical protein H6713_25695 [Myxococcales bacterium]|nr:hypothetical protein [Myxococcales bacterium]
MTSAPPPAASRSSPSPSPSPSPSVSAMLRRGATGELVAWLARDPGALTLDGLARLLARGAKDPALTLLGTLELDRRAHALRGGADAREQDARALAAMLPRELDGAPEVQRLLASLYERLWPWLPAPRSLPAWRRASLPPAIATEWLRVQLLCDPSWLFEHVEDVPREWLLQALAGLELRRSPDPEAVVDAFARHPELALRRAALQHTRAGLAAAVLARRAPARCC